MEKIAYISDIISNLIAGLIIVLMQLKLYKKEKSTKNLIIALVVGILGGVFINTLTVMSFAYFRQPDLVENISIPEGAPQYVTLIVFIASYIIFSKIFKPGFQKEKD